MDFKDIIMYLVVGGFAALLTYFTSRNKKEEKIADKSEEVAKSLENSTKVNLDDHTIVIQAKTRAKEMLLEARGAAMELKSKAEREAQDIKGANTELEKKLAVEKAKLESREREFESKVKQLKNVKEQIEKKQEKIENMYKDKEEELSRVANLTKEEAKKMLLDNLDKELIHSKGKKLKEYEDEIKSESETISQQILIDAMRHGITDLVVEHSTSKIKLPDDDLKGRIIGKEGRNIRKFEELTGVDLDMDSSPGEILVSCFDPVRREIAKIALEKLIADGRIQPARIEEVINTTVEDLEQTMFKAGDDLLHKIGLYNVPKELVQLLGKFKYRFSYGQNMLEHTLETAKIGVYIAKEIGANVEVVKAGCVFHDIGKIIMDKEGTHVDLGSEVLKKFGIDQRVIDCVAQHHDDNQNTIEAAIVALADHISGARPGSRGEDYESYVKRLKNLEEAAMSFDGVEKVYAVSAGREVRVFVSPERVDDYSAAYLAKEIAKKIELEQTYPGTVKVIVIRETRVTETAK